MNDCINFKKGCSPRKKTTLIIIIFLLIFNFLIPIILNSSKLSDNATQNLFNPNIFEDPQIKNPIAQPNIPLQTLSNGEFEGYGNNRSVTAFFDSYGTTNGNSTNLKIETNGWDMVSPNFTIEQLRAYNYTKVLEDQASFSYDILFA